MEEERKSSIPYDEKYKSFIENTGIGIIIFDKNGTHLDVNSAFCGMTGFEKNELIGTNFPSQYWPKHFTQELEKEIQRLFKMGSLKTECFLKRKNETIFPVSMIGSYIKDRNGSPLEFVLLVQDITDIRQAERELKLTQQILISINKKLEKKVEEKTAEVNQLLIQKDEFIKILGHDLKNPLTPLINLVPLLEKKITDSESKKMLSVIHRNVDYMRNLIMKTIELARLDSPNVTFNMERVKLREEVENILEKDMIMFQKNSIKVKNELDYDISVKADKLRLSELFDNILSNAVKHSPDGSTIFLTSRKTSDDFVEISIKDEGAGMTKEQLKYIFDDFYKADPSRDEFRSSGLGLTICKRIVERHGGKIWAESPGLGEGTSFFFSLPVDNSGGEYQKN